MPRGCLLICILLAPLALAQQPSPANPAVTLAAELYRGARDAVAGVPDAEAPRMYVDIAIGEARLFPTDSVSDYQTAFNLAHALPAAAGSQSAIDRLRLRVKAQTEMAAVSALAQAHHDDDALALARSADTPRGPLYDQIILVEKPKTLADVLALVSECERADGTYPYRGVAAVLRDSQLKPVDKLALARDGYRWSAEQQDPSQLAAAPVFLQAGHEMVPELDGQLVSSLASMLTRLSQTNDLGAGSIAGGNRLMTLLLQLDPARAAALGSEYPNIGAQALAAPAAAGAAVNGGDAAAVPQMHLIASASDLPNLPAPGLETGAAGFSALVSQAAALLRKDPNAALTTANQAAGMLDQMLWITETPTAAELATLYQELGATEDAQRLMAHCLDVADQQARDYDSDFQSASPEAEAGMLDELESAQSRIIEVYGLAARISPRTAAERAEATPANLLKPLILMRVAEIVMSGVPAQPSAHAAQ